MATDNINFLRDKNNSWLSKLAKIRCGFELETQSWDGKSWDELAEGGEVEPEYETDYDSIGEAASDIMYRIQNGLGTNGYSRITQKTIDDITEYMADNDIAMPESGNYSDIDSSDWDSIVEHVDSDLRDRLIDTGDFEIQTNEDESGGNRDDDDICSDYFSRSDDIKMSSDGSVSGAEVQTDGPQSVKEFLRLAKIVLSKHFRVDTECSFHIHLSVDNVKHQYGKMLQRAIYYYIYTHMKDVPERVMERWANSEWRARYFSIAKWDADKYNFVAWRGNHNTIEFRCFGNIKSYKDARKCLSIAIQALVYAYTHQVDVPDSFDVSHLCTRIDNLSEVSLSEAA